MRRNYSSLLLLGSVIGISLVVMIMLSVPTMVTAQIPTGSIPTVTGPPMTAFIVVLDNEQGFANVRSGPGTLGYDVVGVLVVGQQAAALGRTVVGDWILIAYPGVPGGQAWIFKDLVEVEGDLQILDPPPTQTPQTTATLDPTLAAQFQVEIVPTRMPTFTAPPALVLPTYSDDSSSGGSFGVPIGFVIIGMAVLGLFGLLVSFFRGR